MTTKPAFLVKQTGRGDVAAPALRPGPAWLGMAGGGPNDFGDLGDQGLGVYLLEEVIGGSGLSSLAPVLAGQVRGEYEHRAAMAVARKPTAQVQAAAIVTLDVQQNHFRAALAQPPGSFVGAARRADHLDHAAARQRRFELAPDALVIIHDHHADLLAQTWSPFRPPTDYGVSHSYTVSPASSRDHKRH